jgi:hypothetical protein
MTKKKHTAGLQGDYLRAAGDRSRHAGHVDKLLPPLLARESSSELNTPLQTYFIERIRACWPHRLASQSSESSSKLKMQTKHAGHVDQLLPPLLACESSSELNKTENLLYRSKSLLSLLGILPLN